MVILMKLKEIKVNINIYICFIIYFIYLNIGTNTFTYLQYSQDGKGQPLIYENDYPLNCCGCLGPKAACRCNCSIL